MTLANPSKNSFIFIAIHSEFKPGRLTAMASSFLTEMPTSSEVFGSESKQPFMPSVIDEKHGNVKEVKQRQIPSLIQRRADTMPKIHKYFSEISTHHYLLSKFFSIGSFSSPSLSLSLSLSLHTHPHNLMAD